MTVFSFPQREGPPPVFQIPGIPGPDSSTSIPRLSACHGATLFHAADFALEGAGVAEQVAEAVHFVALDMSLREEHKIVCISYHNIP